MAAGAVVVSLCSTSDKTIEEAEKRSPAQPLPAYQKQLRLRQNR
ncbi:2-hydroxyglutaryl-CoA dehydratase subunit D [Klebsiella pneumoniae]|uniref:2-hydroxyglutaryl-CoA dehydratase subunit D n=1 Tax=Klebsiella pneumoniae TaxID=573 RepID=A0A2X3CZH0_KLEPN|nr:2-hydroxyglutaryl-CoA dehydratase subunit D [Klebsiella pneumoniae]